MNINVDNRAMLEKSDMMADGLEGMAFLKKLIH